MRDKAIEGLVNLGFRQEWRSSKYGEYIVARVKEAMTDENPVVRMTAAHAFRAVYADISSFERVNVLGELLRSEPNRNVTNVLLRVLGGEANESPQQVDEVLRKLAGRPKPDSKSAEDNDRADLTVEILTFLAITHQTPFATESLRRWAATAPQSDEARRAIHIIRDYLAPAANSAAQGLAFEIVAKAADTCLERWTQTTQERTPEVHVSSAERDEVQHALELLDNIASQIYFASGAFEGKRSEEAVVPDARHTRFADLATPILITCARTKAAPIVHQVVETLLFLAPLDETRALLSLAEAAASDGNYAYDSLSGDLVIPYLKRLLAEHRELVLFEEAGVAAFRKLLTAFASAGNEPALELAFTFADAFR